MQPRRAHPPTLAGVEDRGLVYQAEGGATSLLGAIRDVFLRPVDGETKAGCGLLWGAVGLPGAARGWRVGGKGVLQASD